MKIFLWGNFYSFFFIFIYFYVRFIFFLLLLLLLIVVYLIRMGQVFLFFFSSEIFIVFFILFINTEHRVRPYNHRTSTPGSNSENNNKLLLLLIWMLDNNNMLYGKWELMSSTICLFRRPNRLFVRPSTRYCSLSLEHTPNIIRLNAIDERQTGLIEGKTDKQTWKF